MTERNPRVGRKAELSLKNKMTLDLYYQSKICQLPRVDGPLRRRLGVIQKMFDSHQRTESKALVEVMTATIHTGFRR